MPQGTGTQHGGAGTGSEGPDSATLEAANRLIIEGGFEAIEAAGGYSEWDLFAALIAHDERRFNEIIDRVLAEIDTASVKLMAVFELCVVEYDWTLWIELWSLALRDERARKLRRELDDAFRQTVRGVIEDGVASGEFTVSDLDATTLAIATLIDSMAVQATLRDSTVSPNFMLRSCATVAGRLLGTELAVRPTEARRHA